MTCKQCKILKIKNIFYKSTWIVSWVLLFSGIFAQWQAQGSLLFFRRGGPMRLRDYGTCFRQFRDSLQVPNPDVTISLEDTVRKYGYPIETHEVVTEDGYILNIHQIPHSVKSPWDPSVKKKPVLLHHGLLTSGQSFLTQYKERNLAMLLADSGFDVFIANSRGSRYSLGHTDPKRSSKSRGYWDFSFHEMGIYDLPAIMDMIVKTTGEEKLYYVGYSMGTTVLVVALTERPELNKRISTAFFLAPAIFMKDATGPLKTLAPFSPLSQYFFNRTLRGVLRQPRTFSIGKFCSRPLAACGICGNMHFLLNGYNPDQMNYTTLGIVYANNPFSASSKTFVHFNQIIATDQFCQFDYTFRALNRNRYGKDWKPCYNLQNYVAPTVIYYGENDWITRPQDVNRTASCFGPGALKEKNSVDSPLFNHLDFIMAIDADNLVYRKIVATMQNATYG